MTDVDYDLQAMRRAVEDCDKNIEVFEQAILDEQAKKLEYQRIVRTLESKLDGNDNG
jgi:hypothetical protein